MNALKLQDMGSTVQKSTDKAVIFKAGNIALYSYLQLLTWSAMTSPAVEPVGILLLKIRKVLEENLINLVLFPPFYDL